MVARLRQAGCVVIGKTNTPEFGWTSKTDNALFGLTRNPWNLEHSPGGSSGGSAAAAAGMVPLATGSDGGGSIRIPASACGLSGFKPSFGRVPDGGPRRPAGSPAPTRGPMTSSATIALALDAVVGPDPSDLGSLPRPEASWLARWPMPTCRSRVAWCLTLGYGPVDAEVRAACERRPGVLDAIGIEVIELDGLFEEDRSSSWLEPRGRLPGPRPIGGSATPRYEELDPVLRLLIEGGGPRGGHPPRGDRRRPRAQPAPRRGLPLGAARSVPHHGGRGPAEALGGTGLINGVEDINWVRYTYPFNMTRSPAGTVCVGRSSSGVPIGLQVVGPQHADQVVLRAMAALEDALGFDELAALPRAGS